MWGQEAQLRIPVILKYGSENVADDGERAHVKDTIPLDATYSL